MFFADCNFNSTTCTDCYTGTANCTLQVCFEPGICDDSVYLGHDYFNNAEDCLQYCQSNPECEWFSYDPTNNNICIATSDCQNVSMTCAGSSCVHGQVECEANLGIDMNIMVTTGEVGQPLDDSEVIMTDSITSCPIFPAKYPNEVSQAVAMKHEDNMVVCGGNFHTESCYSYTNHKWNFEPFRLVPGRSGAMSAEIRPGEWLVMGGYSGSNYLSDTQLLKNGIFTNGPELPEAINSGSCVMLNETHLFIAAAYNGSGYSERNYLLDIDTQVWTRVADRILKPSTFHSSGKFLNSVTGEIQVANIGYEGIEVYSPSFDFWREIEFPFPYYYLRESVAIQRGSDSFILIGGESNLIPWSGHIYLFDENGFSVLKRDVLQVPRTRHVAMPISEDDFTCG